jgi:hypothetical protein
LGYYPEFSSLLSYHLGEQDRSAAWLARRLGVQDSTVSRWLEGTTRPSQPETVVRIADCFALGEADRITLLAAAGYAAVPAGTPVPQRAKLVARLARAAQQLPERLAQPLLARPSLYAMLPLEAGDTPPFSSCDDEGLDLDRKRLAISSALGPYFAGLLERSHIYLELTGQIDAPAPTAFEELPPLERMSMLLRHPLGPRAMVIAADAGMGKSTLAAQLVRCVLRRGDYDLLLGDSAKRRQVDAVTGMVRPTTPGYYDVASCIRQMRTQLGLPSRSYGDLSDIVDRLAGRRALIVVDNLETVAGPDELLSTLGRLLGKYVRVLLTTRQVDALPALTLGSTVIHLHPISDHETLTAFLRWHVIRHADEYPLLRTIGGSPSSVQSQRLLDRTGGVPLLLQLVYSAVARLSWSYLEGLPQLYGNDLLTYLYAERWEDLQGQGSAGHLACSVLQLVAAAQSAGERVDMPKLRKWAESNRTLPHLHDALFLLYARFLLVNHDSINGDFVLFPSLAEFVARQTDA